MNATELSIILPTLNESSGIEETLDKIRAAIARSEAACELLVVDGGSTDGTLDLIGRRDDIRLIRSPPGRAIQMNAGAAAARGEWFFFLHADTWIDEDFCVELAPYLDRAEQNAVLSFDLRFRNDDPWFRRMERGVHWRVLTFGLAYGDQGFCLRRSHFEALGGFRPGVAYEDLDFALRLRSRGRLSLLPLRVHTSARQWEQQGYFWASAWNLSRLSVALVHYALTEGVASLRPGGHIGARWLGEAADGEGDARELGDSIHKHSRTPDRGAHADPAATETTP